MKYAKEKAKTITNVSLLYNIIDKFIKTPPGGAMTNICMNTGKFIILGN